MAWTRMQGLQQLRAAITDEPVVSTLACTTIEWYNVEDRHENFYLFGGMGMASSISLGLATALPQRRVIGLEGDGGLLMNLGSLTTISVVAPPNLILIVWDNGVYESTGGQLTHTGRGTDLCALAHAAGIQHAVTIRSADEFDDILPRAFGQPGPWVIVAKVIGNADKSTAPPWTPAYFTERFTQAVNPT